MTHFRAVLKTSGPKLVPFLKSVAVFFVLFPEKSAGNLLYLLFKCIPICCLIGFVLSQGFGMSDAFAYNRRILLGLGFSLLGDVALVFDHLFLLGICLFAFAQVAYTCAFGMRPLRPCLGIAVGCAGVVAYLAVFPWSKSLLLQYVGVVYTALIFLMFWRAAARVKLDTSLSGVTSVTACVCAGLFVASDFCIALNKFVVPLPHADAIIMGTYYVAQLGIAFSVLDSQLERIVKLSSRTE